MDANAIGPASFALTLTTGAFFSIMPKISDVRQANPGDAISADVRTGEAVAATVVIGFGAILSYLLKSKLPLFVALIAVGLLVSCYEMTLRTKGLR